MFKLETFSDYYHFYDLIIGLVLLVGVSILLFLVVTVQGVSDAYVSWRNLNAELAYEEWDAEQDQDEPEGPRKSFHDPTRTVEMLLCPRPACRQRPSLFTYLGSEQVTMTCDCDDVVVARNSHPTELERAWNNAVADRWDEIDPAYPFND